MQNPLEEMEAMLSELDSTLESPQVNGELVIEPERNPGPQVISQSILKNDQPEDEEITDEFEEFVIEKARTLTELVLSNCEEDRNEATAAIQLIKDLITSQDRVVHGGTISRLIQAIDTRSSINMTIVKALESQAKILSARKGPTKQITNNNNTAVGSSSLISILEAGMKAKTN